MHSIEIEEFPTYELFEDGTIVNAETGRVVKPRMNQFGTSYVGLTKDYVQYTRSLALLVAEAFLPRDGVMLTFNTPINLDGDRSNCAVSNLMWRPLWFARLYHQQFIERYFQPINRPVEDISTGYRAKNSLAMAVEFGLLERDVVQSIFRNTYAWPTYQTFRVVG